MIVLFLAFSIPPDWVYLNAKTVQDRHTQRGIEMDRIDEAAIPIGATVRVINPEDWVSAVSSKIRNRDGVVRSFRRDGVFFVDFPATGRRKLFTHFFRPNQLEVIAPSLGEGDGR